MSNPAFLDHALNYAHHGMSVFPLYPQSKTPRILGGFKSATTDVNTVRQWWYAWPDSNLGIATGAVSGLVILDVDPRNGGEESLSRLMDDFGLACCGPIVRTGGGGIHLFFAHPGDAPIPCRSHVGGYRGIDVKSDGGYVVAPPSIHPSGNPYRWDSELGFDCALRPPAPEWLVDLARAGPSTRPRDYETELWDGRLPDSVARSVARFPKVGRRFHRDPFGLNDGSDSGIDYSLACQLAQIGHEAKDIEAALRFSRRLVNLPPRRQSYYSATVGKALALRNQRFDAFVSGLGDREGES